ncbi:MAG: cupin domain-containing protein, partial [Pseudomonadota bacterium]
FLPRWRTEDIMMSAASDGGSVGPHVDRYDVFLVQATGQRHWQIGRHGTGIPDPDATELRLVEPFEPAFEVTASPGDVLYLPPGVPHHGVARGECTTYSIGFRAPSLQDLAAVALEHVDGATLLADPGRDACTDRDAIDPATVDALRTQLFALLADERALVRALGELVTEPKAWLAPEPPEEGRPIGPDDRLGLAPGARLATWAADTLFVNGTGYAVSCEDEQRLIRALAGGGQIRAGDVAGARALAEALLADGALEIHPEDRD